MRIVLPDDGFHNADYRVHRYLRRQIRSPGDAPRARAPAPARQKGRRSGRSYALGAPEGHLIARYASKHSPQFRLLFGCRRPGGRAARTKEVSGKLRWRLLAMRAHGSGLPAIGVRLHDHVQSAGAGRLVANGAEDEHPVLHMHSAIIAHEPRSRSGCRCRSYRTGPWHAWNHLRLPGTFRNGASADPKVSDVRYRASLRALSYELIDN